MDDTDDSTATEATSRAMVPSPSSSAGSRLAALDRLPERLDDRQLAKIEQWATQPLPTLDPANAGEVEDRLLLLMSTLPRQSAGDLDGVLKVEGYVRVIRHLPLPQLDFTIETALRTCRWLPAPAELLDIAARWTRADDATQLRSRSRGLARREHLARRDELRMRLRRGEVTQAEVDAWPEALGRQMDCENFVRALPEGGFRLLPIETPRAGDDLRELLDRVAARFPQSPERKAVAKAVAKAVERAA